jgi:hypothetical protein
MGHYYSCRDNTAVGDTTLCVEEKHRSRGITLYVEDKGESLCIWKYTCAEREILYNTYQEMAIWKSIVTLAYREILALGRKIDISKLIYKYLFAFGR